jgi:streptogramin lyase
VDYLTYDEYALSMTNHPVKKLYLQSDTLYIGTGGGIGRFIVGVDGISGASRWTSTYGMTPLSGNILSIFVDHSGHQWFGTDSGVEEHIGFQAKENWNLYTTAEGLVNDHVLSIAEDESGAMWFGTQGGVSCMKEGVWTSYTREDGLTSDTVYDIAFDPDGSIWFATHTGISHLIGSTFRNQLTTIIEKQPTNPDFMVWFDALGREICITFQSEDQGIAYLTIHSLDGKLVTATQEKVQRYQSQEIRLSTSKFGQTVTPGVYIINLEYGGRRCSKKINLSP